MKVLFINTLYHPNVLGGAEKTVQTLAESLVARGHAAVVISLAPDGVRQTRMVGGVRVHYERLLNFFWPFGGAQRSAWRRLCWLMVDAFNPLMAWRVFTILRRERPDLVQTSNLLGFSCAVWWSARLLRIPIVQMLHDHYPVCANSSTFKQGHNCTRPCGGCRVVTAPRRMLSGMPDGVIALSEATLSKARAFGAFQGTRHVAVIHGAAHIEQPEQVPVRPTTDVLRIGYLGRVEGNKGIETLMQALHLVRTRRPVSCAVAGKGEAPYVASLQALAPEGLVRFLGRVEPASLFEQIDVLVVPSVWEEPLGRVIYEAYTHGVPCVVSDAGGMKEIVEPGRTGEVFAAGDVIGLDEALQRLESGDRQALTERCWHKAREFDMANRYPAYERIWLAVKGEEVGQGERSGRGERPAG